MKNTLEVARQTVVNSAVVRKGNRVYNLVRGKSGVTVNYGKTALLIPDGAVGAAVIAELGAMLGTVSTEAKPKRTRRTKAQIEADNAATS